MAISQFPYVPVRLVKTTHAPPPPRTVTPLRCFVRPSAAGAVEPSPFSLRRELMRAMENTRARREEVGRLRAELDQARDQLRTAADRLADSEAQLTEKDAQLTAARDQVGAARDQVRPWEWWKPNACEQAIF